MFCGQPCASSLTARAGATANSVATLGYNLFGFLPAPCIYGYVSTLGKSEMMASRLAMGCLTWSSLLTVLFLSIGYRKQLSILQEKETRKLS